MAFDPENLIVYLSTSRPTGNTGASGGALNFSEPSTPGSLGDLIAQLPVPALGGLTPSYYYAEGVRNEDPVDWLLPGFWWANLLLKPSTLGPFQITPTHPGQTGKMLMFYRVGGVWVTEEIALDGTATKTSGGSSDAAEDVGAILLTSGGSQTAAPAPIWIAREDNLGMMPLGGSCAFSWGRLGLDPSVDNNLAAADRKTPPVGVTFAAAQDYDSRLLIPGPVDLVGGSPGESIKWWYKITPPDGYVTPSGLFWEPMIEGHGGDGTP